MYFISYQPLKDQLRVRSLSDHEALPYLVISVALMGLVGAIPLIDFNQWDLISAFISVIIAVTGTIYAYHQNGGRAGYDFIQKYIVIGWVVGVRVTLCFILILLLITIVGEFLSVASYYSTGWFDVLQYAIFEIILFQRLGMHIRDTNGGCSQLMAGQVS